MGGGSKGGGSQTSTTRSEPWEGSKPYMQQGMHDIQQLYQYGQPTGPTQYGAGQINTPNYYPGSTIAPMSGYTQAAIDAQAQRAAQGSPLTQGAQNAAQYYMGGGDAQPWLENAARDQRYQTITGANLNSNPGLQGAINYATAPVEASINSAFSSAGRYGSGAQADALARGIGDISSNMAFQNYNMERGLQEQASQQQFNDLNARMNRGLQATALAPGLAQNDYFDINQLGASGSAIDAYNQALIGSDIDRYNYGENAQWNRAMEYLAAVSGAPWGSTTTQPGIRPNAFSSALGGMASGAGLAGMLGATAGSTGSFLGAGAGALLGLLSDERLKTDIEPVGTLNNGMPLYSYKYTFDPNGPTHIGVMAQEAAQVKPDAVGVTPEGFLMVDYSKVSE